MKKSLSGAIFFLLAPVLARADVAPEAPVELPPTDYTAMIVVIVLLVAMVAGFIVFIWWQERRKAREAAEEHARPKTAQR